VLWRILLLVFPIKEIDVKKEKQKRIDREAVSDNIVLDLIIIRNHFLGVMKISHGAKKGEFGKVYLKLVTWQSLSNYQQKNSMDQLLSRSF